MGDAEQFPRRTAVSYIGHPIHFSSGQFAGQTIRTELIEVQKAELGRKYARVDRRPLDPPPAVLLRLYYVYNPGTERESEKEVENYDSEVQNLGLLCNVDLFPVPGSEFVESPMGEDGPENIQTSASSSHNNYPSSLSAQASDPSESPQAFRYPNPSTVSSQQSSTAAQQSIHTPHQPIPGYLPTARNSQDIIAHIGRYPLTESDKCTNALVGATFVQPANVDFKGKKALMFVFADLAVKIEGVFILRYRVFDIFSKGYDNNELAIQAECYGGPFKVYSTKEFPGLHASTDLTKQLARWGVRLNIRETERKRRKRGERQSTTPPRSFKGKGKRAANRDGYGSED